MELAGTSKKDVACFKIADIVSIGKVYRWSKDYVIFPTRHFLWLKLHSLWYLDSIKYNHNMYKQESFIIRWELCLLPPTNDYHHHYHHYHHNHHHHWRTQWAGDVGRRSWWSHLHGSSHCGAYSGYHQLCHNSCAEFHCGVNVMCQGLLCCVLWIKNLLIL